MENEEILNEKEAEEDKKKVEEYFQKKLEKNEFKIKSTFQNIKNTYSDGIIPKIDRYNKVIVKSLKRLNGEENEEKFKINLSKKNKLKLKELHKSNTLLNLGDKTYEKMKNLSKKIKFNINKIKKSHKDLTDLNSLYFDNSIFVDKTHKNSNINRSGILLNLQEKGSLNIDDANNQKNLRNKFVLNSDLYHKQLSNAFIKYNPVIHLNNLKILSQLSPIVREEVTKVKLDVDADIKDIQDKIKGKKFIENKKIKIIGNNSLTTINPAVNKSEDIKIQNNNNNNNVKILNLGMDNKTKKRSSILLPSILGGKGSPRESRIKMDFVQRIKGRNSKSNLNIKDNPIGDAIRLKNISQELEKFIDNDNVDKKIEQNINDFNAYKYELLLKDDNDKKNFNFKPKDYYSSQKSKIKDLYADLYINKLRERIQEKERKLADKLRFDKADYFVKINNEMKTILNEFDNNIYKNNISLDEKKLDNSY